MFERAGKEFKKIKPFYFVDGITIIENKKDYEEIMHFDYRFELNDAHDVLN